MKNSCRKSAPKASPRPPFILVNNLKYCMQYCLLKIRYFERGLSKSLKKVNFIFPYEPKSFQWTKLSKTKGTCN